MATVAVLVGLVVGTLVAWILGDAHFDAVATSAWFGVTTPFYFGWPKFAAAAIISMIVVMLITAVETTGDVFATGEIVEKRIVREDIARALRADGLATTLGGVLNSFPYTCFAENVGLVRLTRIKSRYVVAAAGVIMIILGLLPKAAAIVAGIPHPVLGGAAHGHVRHGGRGRLPDPVPGGLPRPPQRGHRGHQPRPGHVRHRAARRGQGGAGVGADHPGQRHHPGQHHRDPAQPGVPPHRQGLRPGRGRHPGRLDPAGPGQRDVPGGVRAHLLRPVPGPGLGGRAGLRAAPVHRHPRPAPVLPGGAVRGHPGRAGAADRLLPGPGVAVGGRGRRRASAPRRTSRCSG